MILAATLSFFLRGAVALTLLFPFVVFVMAYAVCMVMKAFANIPVLMFMGDAPVAPIPFFESGIKLYASIFGN